MEEARRASLDELVPELRVLKERPPKTPPHGDTLRVKVERLDGVDPKMSERRYSMIARGVSRD